MGKFYPRKNGILKSPLITKGFRQVFRVDFNYLTSRSSRKWQLHLSFGFNPKHLSDFFANIFECYLSFRNYCFFFNMRCSKFHQFVWVVFASNLFRLACSIRKNRYYIFGENAKKKHKKLFFLKTTFFTLKFNWNM